MLTLPFLVKHKKLQNLGHRSKFRMFYSNDSQEYSTLYIQQLNKFKITLDLELFNCITVITIIYYIVQGFIFAHINNRALWFPADVICTESDDVTYLAIYGWFFLLIAK